MSRYPAVPLSHYRAARRHGSSHEDHEGHQGHEDRKTIQSSCPAIPLFRCPTIALHDDTVHRTKTTKDTKDTKTERRFSLHVPLSRCSAVPLSRCTTTRFIARRPRRTPRTRRQKDDSVFMSRYPAIPLFRWSTIPLHDHTVHCTQITKHTKAITMKTVRCHASAEHQTRRRRRAPAAWLARPAVLA